MMFGCIQDVIWHCGDLRYRVHSGFQVLNKNLTAVCCRAVQIPATILDPGNAEGDAIQECAVRAGLDKAQTGLLRVGKHEFGSIIGPQMDNPLCVVHHITGALQFGHHIGAGRELAQVDLAISVRDELLGAVAAVYRPDAELHAGDGFGGVCAVHLHQLHAGQEIVEKEQILCPIPGSQLHLLPAGVQDVAVIAGIHLHSPVGARSDTSQQDLAVGVGLVSADGVAIPVDLEGNAFHGLVALAVIFHDPQTDLGQVLEHQRACGDGIAAGVQLQLDLLHLGGGLIAGRGYDFRHGILAGLDVLPILLGDVPPLDGLQFTVLICVKFIIPVGDGGELEGSGADSLVGYGVPLIQDGLPRAGTAAIFNARSRANLDSACLGGILRGLAGHGEGGVQRCAASGSGRFLDIQCHTAAVLYDIGDRRTCCAVRAGGHGCQRRAAAGGVRIDGEHRAGEGPLILSCNFLQLQVDRLLLRGGGSVGKGRLGGSAAAGEFFARHISGPAAAGDVGQISGVILADLKPEGRICFKINVDRLIGFEREL